MKKLIKKIIYCAIAITVLLAGMLLYSHLKLRYKYQGSMYLRDKEHINQYDFMANIKKQYESMDKALLNQDFMNYPFKEGDPRLSDSLDLQVNPTLGSPNDIAHNVIVYQSNNSPVFFVFVSEELIGVKWYGPFSTHKNTSN